MFSFLVLAICCIYIDTYEEAHVYGNRRVQHKDTASENEAAEQSAYMRKHPTMRFQDEHVPDMNAMFEALSEPATEIDDNEQGSKTTASGATVSRSSSSINNASIQLNSPGSIIDMTDVSVIVPSNCFCLLANPDSTVPTQIFLSNYYLVFLSHYYLVFIFVFCCLCSNRCGLSDQLPVRETL